MPLRKNHNVTVEGVHTEYTHKGYRITAYGKKFKIYKPDGGALSYDKYDSIKEAKNYIDKMLVRKEAGL